MLGVRRGGHVSFNEGSEERGEKGGHVSLTFWYVVLLRHAHPSSSQIPCPGRDTLLFAFLWAKPSALKPHLVSQQNVSAHYSERAELSLEMHLVSRQKVRAHSLFGEGCSVP